MGIVVTLIVIVGICFWLSRDPKEVRDECKGRTADQKKAIRYLMLENTLLRSIFNKVISDEEYDAMVTAQLNSIDFRQRAIAKTGLDESEIQEIAPVNFHGYLFDDKKDAYVKWSRKDKQWRSSAYQVTWLFFSSTEVYAYQYTFNMNEDGKKEQVLSYFYKDVTNFMASSDTVEKYALDSVNKCLGTVTYNRKNVDTHRFSLVVPGDKFWAAMEQTDENERAIQGMKAKLREKKNA